MKQAEREVLTEAVWHEHVREHKKQMLWAAA
jgi:hypothetical protein